MSAPVLHWSSADGEHGQLLVEPGGELWIGRDPACDLVVRSSRASRRHAMLRWEEGLVEVRDRSQNGTRVNGQLLQGTRRELQGDVELEVADHTLRLVHATADDDSPVELPAAARRRIHARLLDRLDLSRLDPDAMDLESLRPRVDAALAALVEELAPELGAEERRRLARELAHEALGLGPLEALLSDPTVSEIMVVEPAVIYAERAGRLERTALRFTDDEAARTAIERIVTPLGRRIDESTPLVDARLPDGSRVNAIIPPLAGRGPCITIRKFPERALQMDDLLAAGALTSEMAALLQACVRARKNLVISGGTGSGKTTLLNVLSGAIPEHERVVTIEDAAELRLSQEHVVSLESRPANMEGRGGYSIRDLLRNALRMRPDRIVVGECRGGEAIDMLQAMNTGHEGSMTTTHANSPSEAVQRLETLSLMAGLDLPTRAIRQQIAASVHLLVQQARFADGARRVTRISEVAGVDERGEVELHDIQRFDPETGDFLPTGYLPSFASELARAGLDLSGSAG
ncbi:MAG: ATPase, T2SS/T4P/T4SS family [Myxococcales bacterium]|nr:ATPase, T2SS/T4P/T4SS family [Myxococcales bacterium]